MTIQVNQTNRIIKVDSQHKDIRVKQITRNINVSAGGRRGPQGIQGEKGDTGEQGEQGIPGEDKNFVQLFTNQDTVTVTHNLNKYPSVTVTDSTGEEVEGDIEHLSVNQLVATFSGSFSGRLVCN